MLQQPCPGRQAGALQLLLAAMMNTVARRTMQCTTPCQKSGTGLLAMQSASLCSCAEGPASRNADRACNVLILIDINISNHEWDRQTWTHASTQQAVIFCRNERPSQKRW